MIAVPAQAQNNPYPSGPVRFVVVAAPGGPVDVVARLIADKIPSVLGQSGVVENRPGAGGILATRLVAAAAPDGLTLLTAANSTLATQKANPAAGYDVERDLIPILNVGWIPNIIVASPDLPVTTIQDVIKLSRTRDMNYGTIGVGTTTHLMTEYLFQKIANTKVQHVVYAGSAPALTAVMGNQIELATVAAVAALPLVKANRLKPIAVTSKRRIAALPDVPTLAEAGFPGNDYVTWVGLFMPAKTPKAVVDRFTEAAVKVMAMPDIREKLAAAAFELEGSSGDAFRREVSEELKHWGKVVEALDIKTK